MPIFVAFLLLASTFQSADDVSLFYVERGKGSPIVVIHGGPGMDHGSLAADLAPLEKRHRVIYYDQRGGGRSTLATQLSIDDHVRDLEALRKHLGLAKLTLLAHSFGPAIAAQYAIQHPDRVERMIFLGPIPPRKGKFFEEYGATMQQRLTDEQRTRAQELSKWDSVDGCREYWRIQTPPRLAKGTPLSVVKSDFCTASVEAIQYGMTKTNPATFGSLGDWDWTAALARVDAPTLILHGEEDAIPMAMVAEWATALPHARLVRLTHTGHFPHAEQPKRVFAEIKEFVKRRF